LTGLAIGGFDQRNHDVFGQAVTMLIGQSATQVAALPAADRSRCSGCRGSR
jgi:hypothetical protein